MSAFFQTFICLLFLIVCTDVVLSSRFRSWRNRHRQRDARRFGRGRRFHFGFGLGQHREEPLINFSIDHFGGDSWWEGPNVCIFQDDNNSTRGEEREISRYFPRTYISCDTSDTTHRCRYETRTGDIFRRTKVWECCHGYTRKSTDYGCPTAVNLKGLLDTAADLRLNQFINALRSVSLEGQLNNGNFTVFAPTDKAFEGLGSAMPPTSRLDMGGAVVRISNDISTRVTEDLAGVLLGHVSLDFLPSSRLSDEQLIETGSPSGSKIRINMYNHDDKVVTANCKRVTSADNIASNGVIHVVDSVLPTVTDSILDLVIRNEELSFLKTAVGRAGLSKILREDGQLTVFAPTNAAFMKLDTTVRDRLLAGGPCLEKLLKNHVLPNVICSAALQGRVRSANALDKYLHFRRDEDKKLFVGEAQVVSGDIMATNGVVHLIDQVLVPEEALNVIDVARKENATAVLDLIRAAGLERTLESAENITFFVPTNEAISDLDKATLATLSSDPQALRDVLTYHVTTGINRCCYSEDRELETLNSGKKIRLSNCQRDFFSWHRSRKIASAQCASVLRSDIKTCNGLIHIVDKVLMPPAGNVVDVLELDSRFSYLVEFLKSTGLADELQADGPFTVFAPTNEVLEDSVSELRDMVQNEPRRLRRLLQDHVVNDAVCCAEIRESSFWFRHSFGRTLSRRRVSFRNRNGRRSVQNADITQCDISASNGVLHVIDDVINVRNHHRPWWFK